MKLPEDLLPTLGQDGAMLVLFMVLFVIAKLIKNQLTPYDLQQELTGKNNVAVAAAMAGYYLAFAIIFCGAYLGPSAGLVPDLLAVTGYTLLGLLLLNLARTINDRLILHRFSLTRAIRDEHNVAAGTLLGCNYIASALVVAGAIHGEGGDVLTALVFFALGQLALVGFSLVYELLTPYSIHVQLAEGNLGAAFGFGGSLIAIGLLIMGGVSGDFVGWVHNLSWLGIELVAIFVYLILVRLFFDKVLLFKADLNAEIARDKNTGAGLLEMASALGFSTLLLFMVG